MTLDIEMQAPREGNLDNNLIAERMEQQIAFLMAIDALKGVMRRSYLVSQGRNENTAEHSWHVAMAAMMLAEHANEPVDLGRVIQMLLVHDIVEIYAGDTYIFDKVNAVTQAAREQEAADKLFGMLPDDQAAMLQQLWHDFESLASPESRYCKSIDRLMPLLINYETFGLSWRENSVDDVMVQEIVERIKPGSLALYQHAVVMKERAVELGYLYKHGE